jgi:hypothetical protein
MNTFYELLVDTFYHLNEYHEYLFWKHNDKRRSLIMRLLEYEHFDIRLLPFEGSEQLRVDAEAGKRRISYPDPFYFTGNFDTLENTDYPIVENYQLPIFSKKFLSVLESVRPFAYEAVPVTIFDFLQKTQAPFLPGGALREDVKKTTDYVYLKLFQFVTLENSRSRPNFGNDIEIIEPEEGLDPVFRVRQIPQRLFITEEARTAIDQFNLKKEDKEDRIKGFRLYDTRCSDYIDYNGFDRSTGYEETEDD